MFSPATHPTTSALPASVQTVLDAGLLGWSTVAALCEYTGYTVATVKAARRLCMAAFGVRSWEAVVVAARRAGIAPTRADSRPTQVEK